MATSGTLTIQNRTGVMLKVYHVKELLDDAQYSGIKKGDTINDNAEETAHMANHSVFIAPRGVGVEISLGAEKPARHGTIHLDIPAIGKHSLSSRDVTNITVSFKEDAPNNSYTAVLS